MIEISVMQVQLPSSSSSSSSPQSSAQGPYPPPSPIGCPLGCFRNKTPQSSKPSREEHAQPMQGPGNLRNKGPSKQHMPSHFSLLLGKRRSPAVLTLEHEATQHPEVFQNFRRCFKGPCRPTAPPYIHLAAGILALGCSPWPESPFLFQPRASSQFEHL